MARDAEPRWREIPAQVAGKTEEVLTRQSVITTEARWTQKEQQREAFNGKIRKGQARGSPPAPSSRPQRSEEPGSRSNASSRYVRSQLGRREDNMGR